MKIAFVSEDVDKYGGTAKVVYEIITRLSRWHEVHLFAATVSGLDLSVIKWHRVPVPNIPKALRVPLFALITTFMVRRGDFDAIVGQGINTFRGDVMVVHSLNAARRKVLRKLKQKDLVRLSRVRRLGEEVWSVFAQNVEKALLRRESLTVVGVSRSGAEEVREYYPGFPCDRVRECLSGVDCNEFHIGERAVARARLLSEFNFAPSDRLVLFVGGLWWLKGLSHVIDSLCYLDKRYNLLVVGQGNTRWYRAHAEEYGVRERVYFLGSRSDMPEIYRSADAFVLPSYYETFSLVTLEAMASGLPVFVSRFNGPGDYLRDGANGFYVEREGRDIAAKIKAAFSDEGRLAEIAVAARETARRFTWSRAAEALETIVAGRSAPRARADGGRSTSR